MRSVRVTESDNRSTVKMQYLNKMEDLAIEMYNETGVQMTVIKFAWKKDQVPESDRMNEMGEDENDLCVYVCESSFM